MTALARHTDPATSHAAAAAVATSVAHLDLLILAGLILRGPMSSHDIAAYIERGLVSVSPRMKPLEQRGLVKRVGRAGNRTLWDVTTSGILAVQ